MFATRTIASLTVAVLALTACAGDDAEGTAVDAPADSSPAVTDPPETTAPVTTTAPSTSEVAPTTTETSTVDTTDPPPSTAPPTTVLPGEAPCVEAPDLVLPSPVEPDAAELAFSTDPSAGRYRSEHLGVALAFDVADAFVDVSWIGGAIVLQGEFDAANGSSGLVAIARPTTYLVGVEGPDEPIEVDDLDTWLSETGVEILDDGPIEVDGRTAREVVLTVPGETPDPGEITEFGTGVALVPGIQVSPSGDGVDQLIVVDVDDDTPLLIWLSDPPGDDAFDAARETFIDGLAIGDAETAPRIVLADTPWNRAWFVETELGPCVLPAIAFGGVEIGLSQPTLVAGEGNELRFARTSEDHSGFSAPRVFVHQPTAIADGGCCRGPEVNDAAGVIATYTDAGYELTELDGAGVTLLGAPARSFEFTSAGGVGFWAGDHDASSGTSFSVFLSDGRTGVFHVADTPLGPVLVQADAEAGTDDLALVEPILADVLASIG